MPDSGLLAGLFSGIASTAILHPIDLIKVRFQVQHAARTWDEANAGSKRVRYRGILDAARSIIREDGVRGMYRGVVPGMLGSGMSWGLYFFFYERLKTRLREWSSQGDEGSAQLGPGGHMACAVTAGCSTVMVTNPVWLVKTRLQLQHDVAAEGEPRPYRGLTDAFRSIVREEGWLGLYRGVGPALLLTSHGAVQFAVFEELKRVDVPPQMQTSWHFLIGAGSKVVASTVTYPYQVIKSRIQARGSAYTGVLHCAGDALRREGPIGLYRGFAANMLRVVPASAITLTMYEASRPAFKVLLGERT